MLDTNQALAEYDAVQEGIERGYFCSRSRDGTPCEFETRHFMYGEDADGNRGTLVSETACIKCGEPQ